MLISQENALKCRNTLYRYVTAKKAIPGDGYGFFIFDLSQQPQFLPQLPPQLLLPLPQQQNRMMMRMMIHRQLLPPQPLLLQHPITKYLLDKDDWRTPARFSIHLMPGCQAGASCGKYFCAKAAIMAATSARAGHSLGRSRSMMPAPMAQDIASSPQPSARRISMPSL